MANSSNIARETTRVGLNVTALVVARLLSMAVVFVQNSLIFRALGPEGSGQYNFALNYSFLFTIIATLGVQRLLVRDIARKPALAWSYAWAALLLVSVLVTLCMIAIGLSIRVIEANTVTRWAVMGAAGSIVALWALQQPFEALIVARERMGYLAGIYIVGALLKLSMVVLLLKTEVFGVATTSASVHGAIMLANIVVFVLYIVLTVRICGIERPTVNLGLVLHQIKECIPFVVAMALGLVYYKFDATLLQVFKGDAGSGIYAPAQRFLDPLLMAASLWSTAVFPALCRLSHAAPDDNVQLQKTTIRFALLVSMPMGIGLILVARPVIGLFTGDVASFEPAVRVMQVYAVVVPLFYFNTIAQEFLYAAHRNGRVVLAYGSAAVVSVAFNLFMIPALGALGLVSVAIAANSVVSAIFIWSIHREMGGAHLPTLLMKTSVACVAMGIPVVLLLKVHLIAAVLAGMLAYVMAQWLLGVLTRQEREMLRAVVNR